jgi:hypothetical protein
MKQIITILLIIAAIWAAKEIQSYWETVKAKKLAEEGGSPAAKVQVPASNLPGMPASLEASLQAAQKQGAAGLKAWLKSYRPYLSDPRLASIELDYVVLIGARNVKEAREVFAAVKERTPANSPVYPRIKQLEETYQ